MIRHRTLRRLGMTLLFAGVLSSGTARAHFLWLKTEPGSSGSELHAFLAETPVPEGPEFLKYIQTAKITAGGEPLSWDKGEDAYVVKLPGSHPPIVDGFCDLGVMSRKDESFRLLYTARVQIGPVIEPEAATAEHLRVRLLSDGGKPPVVVVTFRGKPVAGAVVKAFPDEGDPFERKTDDNGTVAIEGVAEGKAGLLAKWSEASEGEQDGKAYREARYYATFTVTPSGNEAKAAAESGSEKKVSAVSAAEMHAPLGLLPEAVNSFGGAVAGDWLYVYSGHIGETHKYHEATTTPHFRRLNLKDRTTWEELPAGPSLQGMPLVAHNGKLYRTGGMAAHNKPGKPQDLVSVADFARFDPETRTWTDLPSLPSPRSTHDAVVVGDKLYVVGGWCMNGGDAVNSDFHTDALVYDLSKEDAEWEKLPEPPFQRRALAVAAIKGKVYVLGGLTEGGKVVKTVDIYDPASQAWTAGPELPGGNLEGFAASAFGVDDRLYVSGYDGSLYRLNEEGSGWDTVGAIAVPRLTHRLLPGINSDLLAVGGNFAGVPTKVVESIRIDQPEQGPKVVTVPVTLPPTLRRGAAVNVVGSRLLIVGGSHSPNPHGFQPENLANEAVAISLGTLDTEPRPSLPSARQSDVLLTAKNGRKTDVFLVGGIGADGDVSRTLGDVYQLDAGSQAWTRLNATIPDQRGMFAAADYKDALWIFGGSIWDPRAGHEKQAMPLDVLRWERQSEGSSFEPTSIKLPRPRRSFAGALVGSKYYLIGGLGDDQEIVGTVDVLNLDSGEWTTAEAPASPRLFADAAVLDGKIYLAGGFVRGEERHMESARSVEVFDPAAGTWSVLMDESPVPPGHIHLAPVQNRLVAFSLDPESPGRGYLAFIAP